MKEEYYIKSYPHDTYTERVDADKLAEGRIYLIETPRVETRFQKAYVCVRQVFLLMAVLHCILVSISSEQE